MNITIIGLGLIGGSLARDLRRMQWVTSLVGVDENPEHAAEALQLGLVDDVRELSLAVKNTDLVLVSIPVNATVSIMPDILDKVNANTVVIDTGSTKAAICNSVRNHPRRNQFVAAHPISGTENSGPGAARDKLFLNKTMIVCERQRSSQHALDVAQKIFNTIGVKTIFMEPVEHDKHVAYVSHLSHVSSFLLGQTVMDIEKDEKNIFELAGSGFASTVRLAKSSPDMWAPIFEQNVEYLSQALLEYIMHLQRFHYHLMKRDTKEIHRIMKEANEIRRVLSGIELNEKDQKTITTITEEN